MSFIPSIFAVCIHTIIPYTHTHINTIAFIPATFFAGPNNQAQVVKCKAHLQDKSIDELTKFIDGGSKKGKAKLHLQVDQVLVTALCFARPRRRRPRRTFRHFGEVTAADIFSLKTMAQEEERVLPPEPSRAVFPEAGRGGSFWKIQK